MSFRGEAEKSRFETRISPPPQKTRGRRNDPCRIGLIGCGNIGSTLAREIQRRFRGKARLIGIYDLDEAQARRLSRRLRPAVPILPLNGLIQRSQLIIEAASAQAAAGLLPKLIARRKPALFLSTAGLLRQPKWLAKARATGVPLSLPSGALVGLDGIKAAAVGKLRSVTLTTRKPPRAFAGAPWVLRRKIRLDRIKSARVLFEGNARQAAAAFPSNVNVAATLALAGLGPAKTRVRVIADPSIRTNIHEVEAAGSFGRLFSRVENLASKENPKSSRLAAQSAVAALQQLLEPFRVGT